MAYDFISLHNHTDHGSILDGFAKPREYLAKAKELGQTGAGITDHGTLYGVYDFLQAGKDLDVTAVPGCLLAGQEIITSTGIKAVEDVKEGDLVITHKGRFRKVLKTMKKEYNGLGYSISLNGKYSRTLTLTEEHPILIRDRKGEISWQEPGDIKTGQTKKGGAHQWHSYVCLPKLENSANATINFNEYLNAEDGWFEKNGLVSRNIATNKGNSYIKDFTIPAFINIDDDIAYLFGIYAAEGSLKYVKSRGYLDGSIEFSHHINEKHISEKIISILFDKFGLVAKTHARKEVGRENSLSTLVNSKPLALMLEKFVGRKAKNKFIHIKIMEASKSIRKSFLRGLIDGDGTTADIPTNPQRHENYKSISRDLAWGMKTILADLGHFNSITEKEGVGNREKTYAVSYNPYRTYSRDIEDEDYTYRGIKEINPVQINETVYNFEVEEDNSYVSDFVLHNCEFYVAPQNPDGAKKIAPVFYGINGEKNPKYDVSRNGAYLHITIWAYNNAGLHNLFKLSTLSNKSEHYYHKPRIDFDMLVEYSEGLIVSTGCPSSEISTRFLMEQDAAAYDYARRLKEVFGENLYIEVMDHSMSIELERILLPKQIELAQKLDIELLATNDCHYANQSDHFSHEEVLCSQSGSVMSDKVYEEGGKRFAFNGNEYYMKSSAEMNALFPQRDYPNAIKNSLVIAEKAQDVRLAFNDDLKPKPMIPEEFNDEFEYYQFLIQKGYTERYHSGIPADIRERAAKQLEYETEVIHSSDFVGYMLVVADYLNYTRDNYSVRDKFGEILASPLGPGRGSVGGSITAFVLYISDIEPLRHGLIFERFLSSGRGNTYEICYNNGEREEIIVSDTKKVDGEEKYIHQLKVGDVIEEM